LLQTDEPSRSQPDQHLTRFLSITLNDEAARDRPVWQVNWNRSRRNLNVYHRRRKLSNDCCARLIDQSRGFVPEVCARIRNDLDEILVERLTLVGINHGMKAVQDKRILGRCSLLLVTEFLPEIDDVEDASRRESSSTGNDVASWWSESDRQPLVVQVTEKRPSFIAVLASP
jgi:hypothetical protein